MATDIGHGVNSALGGVARNTTPPAALAAFGIVCGDHGTSPRYTLQAVVGATGGHFPPDAALDEIEQLPPGDDETQAALWPHL